jgi:hypothetical protein
MDRETDVEPQDQQGIEPRDVEKPAARAKADADNSARDSFQADVLRFGLGEEPKAGKPKAKAEEAEDAGDDGEDEGQVPEPAGAEDQDGEQDDDEGAEESESESEADRNWDKNRQRRDQEAANERRQAQKTIDALNKANDSLQKALAVTRKKPAETAVPAASQVDVDDLLAQADGIDATSDATDVAKVIKGLILAVKQRAPGAETPAEVKALQDTVKELKERVAESDRRVVQRQVSEDSRGYREGLEKRYPGMKAAAEERAKDIFAEMGFDSGERRPDLPTWKAVMRAAFAEVAAGATRKGKPAHRSGTPQPSMVGGRAAPAARKGLVAGSLAEVAAQKRRELGL